MLCFRAHTLRYLALLLSTAALAGADPPGLRHERLRFKDVDYDVVRLNLEQQALELHWKDTEGRPVNNFAHLRETLDREGRTLLFATNAGIYARDDTPLGLHIEAGRELHPVNTGKGGRGNFFLKPNGVFHVTGGRARIVPTDDYLAQPPSPQIAVQSGPMLVINGELHPKLLPDATSKNIRNGVGVTRDGEVVFAISRAPIIFHDFASLFRDPLDCPDALYLDGKLSGMYAPFAGREDAGLHYVGIFAVTTPKEP